MYGPLLQQQAAVGTLCPHTLAAYHSHSACQAVQSDCDLTQTALLALPAQARATAQTPDGNPRPQLLMATSKVPQQVFTAAVGSYRCSLCSSPTQYRLWWHPTDTNSGNCRSWCTARVNALHPAPFKPHTYIHTLQTAQCAVYLQRSCSLLAACVQFTCWVRAEPCGRRWSVCVC
jgi:hypothetical protein